MLDARPPTTDPAVGGTFFPVRAEMTRKQAQELLGVDANARALDVRRAFKRLALRHHPDRNPDDPRAHECFVRLCLAYDILTGARPAAHEADASPQPATDGDWTPPWTKRPEPPAPPPTEYADGEPIHYPTPAEIEGLDAPDPFPRRQRTVALLFFLPFALVVCALAVLEVLSDRAPAQLDSVRQGIRRSIGRNWGTWR
jgi:DnaJ domain